jgi:hypothetical protein
MAYLGRRPLPDDHWLNRGGAIVVRVSGPLPPVERPPGSPTEEELEEEGRHGEALRPLKLHRMRVELADRVRLQEELGHKIAPRVLDSRWDRPPYVPVPTPPPPQSAPNEPPGASS